MDLKLIKNLLTMISDSEVDEVSIEEGEFKISIKKNKPQPAQEQVYYAPPAQAAPQQTPAAAPAQDKAAHKADDTSGETIKSPIVGTFYSSPSPEDPPYVKVGQTVKKGDVLCIVEAMKIMNEIEAEVSGTITKVLVDNAQPVEFDQPLFLIQPS